MRVASKVGNLFPNLGMLGLLVFELFAMYATYGQTDGRTKAMLIALSLRARGHNIRWVAYWMVSPVAHIAYNIGGWLFVWMSSNFFINRYSSYSFCPILTKLGTRDLCANAQKTVEQIFEILILKCSANLWNLRLEQQWSCLGQQGFSGWSVKELLVLFLT